MYIINEHCSLIMYNPMILQQLAPHIKSARIALGLSQLILAQRAAVSRTTLSRLEGGKESSTQIDVIERILGALALSPRVEWAPPMPDMEKRMARLHEQIRMQEIHEKHWRLALDLATRPREMKSQVKAARAPLRRWVRSTSALKKMPCRLRRSGSCCCAPCSCRSTLTCAAA